MSPSYAHFTYYQLLQLSIHQRCHTDFANFDSRFNVLFPVAICQIKKGILVVFN